MKKLIALLLSALLLLCLAACSKSGSNGSSTPPSPTQNGNAAQSAVTTQEPAQTEQPPAPETEDQATAILGTWKMSTAITSEKLNKLMQASLLSGSEDQDPDLVNYFLEVSNGIHVPAIVLSGTYTFNADGTLQTKVDPDAKDSFIEGLSNWLRQALPAVTRYEIEKELEANDVSLTVEDYLA